jgi:valyl-tRNA synthetase
LHELCEFVRGLHADYVAYRFDYVTQRIMKFLREIFCDTYIEGLKVCLQGPCAAECRDVAAFVFAEFLKVSNPVIPFVTEHLWEALAMDDGGNCEGEEAERPMLLVAKWIQFQDTTIPPNATQSPDTTGHRDTLQSPCTAASEADYKNANLCIGLTSEIRSLRGLLNVSPATKLKLTFCSAYHSDEKIREFTAFIKNNADWICALGRLSCVEGIEG